MVESRQNGRCISCKEPITRDHAVISKGDQEVIITKIALKSII